jgi:enamine deaminase RidA (YjgF/YER057c/UK114 family)
MTTLELPPPLPIVGNYLLAKRHGDLLFVSGHVPVAVDRPMVIRGKVGADLTLEQAREAARITTLYLLSTVRAELGSLDRVRSIIKVFGSVNVAPGFTDTPAVIDGCSDLLVEVFGPQVARHARAAIGVAELPENAAVEIEMVIAIDTANEES